MSTEEIKQKLAFYYRFPEILQQCPNKFIYWKQAYSEHDRLNTECECNGTGYIVREKIDNWVSCLLNHYKEMGLNNTNVNNLFNILKTQTEKEFFIELWRYTKKENK